MEKQNSDHPGAHDLPESSISEFHQNGFLSGIPVLAREEVEDLRERVDWIRSNLKDLEPRLYEVEAAHSENPDGVVCHFLGGWLVDSKLNSLVFDRRITLPLAQLLGVTRLRFWHDQVFYKPAGHPGEVPWHQDYSYWTRTAPPRHITMNIMLDDADDESGCVCFVPGSHRWQLLPPIPFDAPLDRLRDHLGKDHATDFHPQPARIPAGFATVHHSHTVHGSTANRSSRPRRAIVFNYMADDTRVADDAGPLLRHAPPLKMGDVVEGDLFPIVIDLEE